MNNTNENNTLASIISYFLSKYNSKALEALGYKSQSECFRDISNKINLTNSNFIRLRMNEFDPFFPDNGRVGFNKRPANKIVKKIHQELNFISFEELANRIKKLLEINKNIKIPEDIQNEIKKLTETEIENILNFEDKDSKIITELSLTQRRVLNISVINQLKEYYKYRCQICGKEYYTRYNCNIVEGHHIDYFSKSLNNNASNIIIVCPNHHRIIHKKLPFFDKENKLFKYDNGLVEELKINDHL